MAQPVEHQFRVVIELQADPIPSALPRVHRIGKELVIHPGVPFHGDALAVEYDGSRCEQAGEGDVVRGVTRAARLAADAIAAVNHRWLGGGKIELNCELLVQRSQRLVRRRYLHLPIAIPYQAGALVDAGDTGTGAIDPFVVIEPATPHIAKSKMRHIEIVDAPR